MQTWFIYHTYHMSSSDSLTITAFYAPWCDVEVADFIRSVLDIVSSSIELNSENSVPKNQFTTRLQEHLQLVNKAGFISKPIASQCVLLYPSEYCTLESINFAIQELSKVFETVIFENKDEISKIIVDSNILHIPCVSINKTASGSNEATNAISIAIDYSSTDIESSSETDQFATALQHYNNFEFMNALREFTKLLRKNPKHSGALFNSAGILHMIGYPTLAIQYLHQLLSKDPNDSIAHSFLWALATSADGKCLKACINCYRSLSASKNQ